MKKILHAAFRRFTAGEAAFLFLFPSLTIAGEDLKTGYSFGVKMNRWPPCR
jgi:hypothetical protein